MSTWGHDDQARFSPVAFLRDRLATMALGIAALVFTTCVLLVLDVTIDGVILVISVLLAVMVLSLVIEYRRRKGFWQRLDESMDVLDKTSYFGDLVREPEFLEGVLAYETLLEATKHASDEIAELEAQNNEHAAYTELWVHEVKTPLAAAKLLLDKMHGPDAGKLKYELERMEGLVEQALFAARSSTLANDYLIREINLADVVNEACKANMRCLTSRGISIDIQVDPGLRVFADKAWLAFMLGQLISNSAKYDARTITFRVMPPPDEGPHTCTIFEIADDGCGIPAADVPRVFDRGFTGEVGRAHGSATGMGLYLVARMCGQLGLGIMLASEEGVGTRVSISFPHDRRRMRLQK